MNGASNRYACYCAWETLVALRPVFIYFLLLLVLDNAASFTFNK